MSDEVLRRFRARTGGELSDEEGHRDPLFDSDSDDHAVSDVEFSDPSSVSEASYDERDGSPPRGTSVERQAAGASPKATSDRRRMTVPAVSAQDDESSVVPSASAASTSTASGPPTTERRDSVPHMIVRIPVERDQHGRLLQPPPTRAVPPSGCSLILCYDTSTHTLYWRAVRVENTKTYPTQLPEHLQPMAVFWSPDGKCCFRRWPSQFDRTREMIKVLMGCLGGDHFLVCTCSLR